MPPKHTWWVKLIPWQSEYCHVFDSGIVSSNSMKVWAFLFSLFCVFALTPTCSLASHPPCTLLFCNPGMCKEFKPNSSDPLTFLRVSICVAPYQKPSTFFGRTPLDWRPQEPNLQDDSLWKSFSIPGKTSYKCPVITSDSVLTRSHKGPIHKSLAHHIICPQLL